MKKVLVTGGAGFIGSAIVNDLIARGDEVFVLDNLSFGSVSYIPTLPKENFFNADLLDASEVKSVVGMIKPDAVLHLAAIHFIPYCNQHPFESANINIQGTINLVDALRALPNLNFFLFASTAAVYPICDVAVCEDTPPSPTDIYGLSKLAGERICREFHLETGVPSIICRFFNAFGPNETNPHIVPVIEKQVKSGATVLKLGNLEPKRDYIHTSDISAAVQKLLSMRHAGLHVFNLGSGREYSVREIVDAFETCSSLTFQIEKDEKQVRKQDRMHLLADISRISKYIDWKPQITLVEGIRQLVKDEVHAGA